MTSYKTNPKKYLAEWYQRNKKSHGEKNKLWAISKEGKEYKKTYYKEHYVRKLLPINDRFWNRVDRGTDESCWLWTGKKYPNGYGRLGKRYAHRFSYELNVGKIPKGMCVCHSCDNPGCVNPMHLWVGTVKDNMQDREKKGRGRYSRVASNKQV